MSWDVMLFSQDPGPITGDMKIPPLGDADFVRARISKSLPGVDWSDPSWGILQGDGWSIEFNQHSSGVTDAVMLHVRGGGDPIAAIVRLCKDTGWVAFDLQSEALIDLNTPSDASWKEFQGFRDTVTGTASTPPPDTRFPVSLPIFCGAGLVAVLIIVWFWTKR